MTALKLIPIDDSLGVALPDELLARLQWKVGDSVCLTEDQGRLMLSLAPALLDSQMSEARRLMQRRSEALRKLSE
tara:strand:- start:418 stop:642 length:225 start_codon:yes stop_codon:yes gene_type:complete